MSKRSGKGSGKKLVVESLYLCGHKSGLCPREWTLSDGSIYHATDAQAWLWEQHENAIKRFGKQPDYLAINGGIFDEIPHLTTREVAFKDRMEQARLAIHIIKQWDAKEIYLVYGSGKRPEVEDPSTEGEEDEDDEVDPPENLNGRAPKTTRTKRKKNMILAEDYVAEQVGAAGVGHALRPVLAGVPTSFAYKTTKSISIWTHRTTPMAVQMAIGRLQRGSEDAQIVVRSSPQYFCVVGFETHMGIITPGWAAQTPYDAQTAPENVPKIGTISVDLSDRSVDYVTWDAPLLQPIAFTHAPASAALPLESSLFPFISPVSKPLKDVKDLVMTGDWHCGSEWALCPEKWKLQSGATYCANPVQLALFERFLECVEQFKRPDCLLVNADLIDGTGRIDSGRDICFTNPWDQVHLAEYLISLWKAKHVLITYGSKYHVERDAVLMENFIANHVKADEHGFILKPTIAGRKCSFSHEIPVGSNMVYRPTAVAAQLVTNKLNNNGDFVNLLGRSHVHSSCWVRFSEQLGVAIPCFEGQTPYMARKMPEAKPKIGVYYVELPSMDLTPKTWDGPQIPEASALERALEQSITPARIGNQTRRK